MDPAFLSESILFSLVGSAIGLFTGLVPGIHVNTLASILLVSFPSIELILSGIVPTDHVPVIVCCMIMSASVVHSFVDFVPSVFIGAPDAEDAISVLPGHRLLLKGEGMAAVRSAAIGSLIGCSAAILLALPLQLAMLNGAADFLNGFTRLVIVVVIMILMYNEYNKGNLLFGLTGFFLSGVLGYAVMRLPIPCTGILGEGTLLMPMLTGLFGLPVLLTSGDSKPIPHQTDKRKDPVGPIPGLKGVIMGSVAGWFPGITSTVGATISATIMPERNPERFISTVASIGTVTTVLSLVTLSVSGGGRSGTVIVIGQILGDAIGGFASRPLVLLLLSAAVSSLMGYGLTIWAGRTMSGFISRIRQDLMSRAVILFLIVIVFLSTGPWGMAILFLATVIGFIPVSNDSGKTALCGCLLLPSLVL